VKRFFEKLGHYLERPYWSESGILFGEDWIMLAAAEEQRRALERRLVYAPVLDDRPKKDVPIRIKAMIDPHHTEICHFMVERLVLPGYSARFCSMKEAEESPLARDLFEVGGLNEIVFHESLVSASRDPAIDEEWKTMAEEIGERIRAHLLSGLEIVSPDFFSRIPPEDQIIRRVQKVIDEQINPRLSGHDGQVRLERIKNNTIWISMGGSCQGCAEAPLTFRHDVGAVLHRAIPALGAIYDATDHLAGVNPYFRSRPDSEDRHHEAA